MTTAPSLPSIVTGGNKRKTAGNSSELTNLKKKKKFLDGYVIEGGVYQDLLPESSIFHLKYAEQKADINQTNLVIDITSASNEIIRVSTSCIKKKSLLVNFFLSFLV